MISVEQIRSARAMLGLKQAELAKKAGLSTATLNNIERSVQLDPKLSTMRAIQQALESCGISFLNPETGEQGLLMKRNASAVVPMLIIDDNAADRKLFKVWLGKAPEKKFKVTEAANAKDGYEAFVEARPACIVLDFMMYGKDGFQMLAEMRKDAVRTPPIIFVTAMHSDVIKKDVMALGVHTYLDKKSMTKNKFCEAVLNAVS